MRKVLSYAFVGVLAVEALVWGQGADAAKVLAAAREALGGDQKLAAITSLTATGHNARAVGETSTSNDFEMAIALPDKFMRKDVVAVMNGMTLSRTSGFNGDGLIEAVDAPQMGSGGIVMMRSIGPGGGVAQLGGPGGNGPQQTPEQIAATRAAGVLAAKQDFARLTLGMFAASFSAYPLQFSVAGVADSPDGKADILDVKGDGEFSAKLFIDQKTHLPLMLSWMAKEPITLGGAMSSLGASGGVNTVIRGGGAGGGGTAPARMTPEEIARMQQDLQDRMKDAQAKARLVEYRVFYGDYQTVDGVKLPTKFSRAIDGKATEELTVEKYKLNAKIDARKFEVSK